MGNGAAEMVLLLANARSPQFPSLRPHDHGRLNRNFHVATNDDRGIVDFHDVDHTASTRVLETDVALIATRNRRIVHLYFHPVARADDAQIRIVAGWRILSIPQRPDHVRMSDIVLIEGNQDLVSNDRHEP
jgi:Ser/Thr protein kinase RdoA (MazF antagonist)